MNTIKAELKAHLLNKAAIAERAGQKKKAAELRKQAESL